jgi:hypothetical protein
VPRTAHVERVLRGVAARVGRPRVAVQSAVHDHPRAGTDRVTGVVRDDLGAVPSRLWRGVPSRRADATRDIRSN